MFNDHIIDAHYVQVLKPKGDHATVELDLTACIKREIQKEKNRHRIITAQRKELDKHAGTT